jgi:hypothetical protein
MLNRQKVVNVDSDRREYRLVGQGDRDVRVGLGDSFNVPEDDQVKLANLRKMREVAKSRKW